MPRKKILFVIVEGPSDDAALSVLLSRFFDSNVVHVHVMHCDITTELGVTPNNIVRTIGDCVKKFAGRLYKSGDFCQIIHIVDMDGAFIPNNAVVEDASAAKPIYSITEIRTRQKSGIENRNLRKRENLNRLLSTPEIWKIPYRVYYMSCNLDHALYGKLNSTDEEKENDAFFFAKTYMSDIPGFIQFISESDFSVTNDVGNLEVVRRDCAGNARKVVDDSVGFVVFQGVQHSVDVGSCLV